MDRIEIKQLLIDMGVKQEFVEMPAIVEQIYREYSDVSLERARKANRIVVRENGNFSFGNAVISLDKDGGATIVDGDIVIKTNEYGMETSFLEGDQFGRFSNVRRNDGKIISRNGNTGEARLHETISADTGHWAISDSRSNVLIDRINYGSGEEINIAEAKPEKIMADFEYNAETVIRDYPKTAEYYEALRKSLKKTLERQTDPLQVEIAKNADLQKQVDKLRAEKADLATSLEKSNGMLGESLKFMERVRNHPIGKMFFGKDAKKFEENKARLYSGNETREEDR